MKSRSITYIQNSKWTILRVSAFLVFLNLCCFNLTAQDNLNFFDVDSKSYQFYEAKNWQELVTLTDKAVAQKLDYYYLRMRAGIANYEMGNYVKAQKHFEKALAFNSGDELAMEYIYYCYIYLGRNDEARLFSKLFSSDLAKKIGTDKQSAIGFILFEGGAKIADSTSYYDVVKKTQSNYYNPATYIQLGLQHYIKNRFSLFHAFTFYGQTNFIGELKQTQYYLKSSIPLKNNWSISPAFHAIHIKFTSEIFPLPTNTANPSPPPKSETVIYTANYFVGAFSVQKTIDKFVFSVGNTMSNMSDITQIIHSGFVSYSVFGNSKLVLGCTGYVHTSDSYSTTNASALPFLYVQPVNKLAFKLAYLINNGNNIIEDNGYLVNNSPDLTKSRLSVLINYNINKHLSVYGLYQLENKTETNQGFNYKYNVFLGGLKFIP